MALYVPRDHAGTIAYEKLNAGPWQVGRDTPRAGIVVGKFNRDQNLDIAIAGANDVTLLFGNGSGGFTIGQTLPLQGGVLNALAVGDFTSLAGTDDLAIGIDLDANRGSAVMIARWDDQTGQMKLATDRPISVGGAGTGGTLVAAADLTRPGIRRDLSWPIPTQAAASGMEPSSCWRARIAACFFPPRPAGPSMSAVHRDPWLLRKSTKTMWWT